MISRLNQKYGSNGVDKRKKLSKTAISRLKSQCWRKPNEARPTEPKISPLLLDLISAHIEICQVSHVELDRKQVKWLIAAAFTGTPHETQFTVESVWKKLCRERHSTIQALQRCMLKLTFGAKTMQLELEAGKVSRASKTRKSIVQELGKGKA
jgi:hypothetical protein